MKLVGGLSSNGSKKVSIVVVVAGDGDGVVDELVAALEGDRDDGALVVARWCVEAPSELRKKDGELAKNGESLVRASGTLASLAPALEVRFNGVLVVPPLEPRPRPADDTAEPAPIGVVVGDDTHEGEAPLGDGERSSEARLAERAVELEPHARRAAGDCSSLDGAPKSGNDDGSSSTTSTTGSGMSINDVVAAEFRVERVAPVEAGDVSYSGTYESFRCRRPWLAARINCGNAASRLGRVLPFEFVCVVDDADGVCVGTPVDELDDDVELVGAGAALTSRSLESSSQVAMQCDVARGTTSDIGVSASVEQLASMFTLMQG